MLSHEMKETILSLSVNPQLHRKPIFLTLIGFLLIVMGASLTAADDLVQPDGRINQVTHFGGDAFYCVDRDFQPTNQYSDFGTGGFRLLNEGGQELWFVPALDISAAVAEAKETGKVVLVAEGRGTYGPVDVYAYVTGENDDYFVFNGYDEYGKPNSITFKFCIPVGPASHSDPVDDGEDPCVEIIYRGAKLLAPVSGGGPLEPCVPDCEEYDTDKLPHKEFSQVPLDDCLQG